MKQKTQKWVKGVLIGLLILAANVFMFLFGANHLIKGTDLAYPALLLSYDAQQDTVQMQIKLPDGPYADKVYTVSVSESGGIDTNGSLPFRQKGDPSQLHYPYFVRVYADEYPPEDSTGVISVKYIESATT